MDVNEMRVVTVQAVTATEEEALKLVDILTRTLIECGYPGTVSIDSIRELLSALAEVME